MGGLLSFFIYDGWISDSGCVDGYSTDACIHRHMSTRGVSYLLHANCLSICAYSSIRNKAHRISCVVYSFLTYSLVPRYSHGNLVDWLVYSIRNHSSFLDTRRRSVYTVFLFPQYRSIVYFVTVSVCLCLFCINHGRSGGCSSGQERQGRASNQIIY